MTSQNNQSAVQTMLNAFQAQGVVVEESTFFGVPVRAYFGEPAASEAPVKVPAAAWQVDSAVARKTMAKFGSMGARQENPTFFGTPVSEYLGHVEKGIWQKIVEDLVAMSPVVELINQTN